MLRNTLAGAVCVTLFIAISATTPDLAHAAQVIKGNKLVLQFREVRNYERPRRNGNRLSFCTALGECGKPAADEFCRSNGFEGMLTFQRDHMEGHGAQLRFLRIKCWRAKGSTARQEADASAIPKAVLRSNSSAKSNRR